MDFKKVLEIHLNCMKQKKLDEFLATVQLDAVTVILPNGTMIAGRDGFIKLHQDWFSDADWTLEFQILRIEESAEMSYALVSVDYQDLDSKGSPVYLNYYLNLIFKKIDETWLLIHDQNTIFTKK